MYEGNAGESQQRSVARLDGHVALITGGGRGIGRALAIRFAQEGAAVAVTARTVSEVQETAFIIPQCGGRAIGIPGDVSDLGGARRVVARTISELGPISLL